MVSWKSEFHVFAYEDRRILYQVQSGAFFEIDAVVGAILDSDDESRESLIASLSPALGFDQIVEALGELEAADLITFGPRCPLTAPSATDSSAVDYVAESGATEHNSAGLAQSLAEMNSRPHATTITLHVSHACNISCTYCFALGGSYGGKPELMTWDTARQAVKWLLAISEESRRCQIDFFGGEPLLALDLMKQIVAYARAEAEKRDIHIDFGITTNGTLLEGDALEFLMQEDIGIMVSVDGPKESHNAVRKFHNGGDTFDVVAENVRTAAAKRPDLLHLRSTMTSKNLNMPELVARLDEFGVDGISVSPTWESPHSPTSIRMEHVTELNGHIKALSDSELAGLMSGDEATYSNFRSKIKQVLNPQDKRQYGCGGGKTYFGVDVKGDIYFCSAFGSMPEYKMGDVWNGLDRAKDEQFRRDLHVDNRKGCSTCWARHLCGGGCAYDARVATGSTEGPNPVACERIRYGYELAMGMALELGEASSDALGQLQD